jgi:hypothetical protein
MGPIGFPETSVGNHKYTVRDVPEEHRSHIRPRIIFFFFNFGNAQQMHNLNFVCSFYYLTSTCFGIGAIFGELTLKLH